jgi:hypothetical protein
MAYSRFFDSDIYIYAHVGGYIECCACWLNENLDEYSLFGLSEKITNDDQLIEHIRQHRQLGHNIPDHLEAEILSDPDRYDDDMSDSTWGHDLGWGA